MNDLKHDTKNDENTTQHGTGSHVITSAKGRGSSLAGGGGLLGTRPLPPLACVTNSWGVRVPLPRWCSNSPGVRLRQKVLLPLGIYEISRCIQACTRSYGSTLAVADPPPSMCNKRLGGLIIPPRRCNVLKSAPPPASELRIPLSGECGAYRNTLRLFTRYPHSTVCDSCLM